MAIKDPNAFSIPRFLKDVEELCKVLNAPFSESTTKAILNAYDFRTSVVGWRATSKDNAINYRWVPASPIDAVTIAIQAEFIKPSHMAHLVQSWTMLYKGEAEQWCDFDPAKGLAKTWVFLGQTRQMEEVLDVDFVPSSIRRHVEKFKQHGLDRVRTLAVDWHSGTVNIYWRAPGPLSKRQVDGLVGLAGCPPLEETEVEEIRRFASAQDGSFAFAVTLSFATGEIGRVAFYATKLARGKLPVLGDRLATFIKHAPSYDSEEFIVIGWGFGKNVKYLKAEKSYCGQFMDTVKDMVSQDPNL